MPLIRKIRKGSRSNSSPSNRYTAATCLHGLDQSGHDQSVSRPSRRSGNMDRPTDRKVSSMFSGIRPDSRPGGDDGLLRHSSLYDLPVRGSEGPDIDAHIVGDARGFPAPWP